MTNTSTYSASKKSIILFLTTCLAIGIISSCKSFLDIDPPKTSLVQGTVFGNDSQATSALVGIYATMSSGIGFASGGYYSVTCFGGLVSDELLGYSTYIPFYENQLTSGSNEVATLYTNMYETVYACNSVIEGIRASNTISQNVSSQLLGEALFLRAFSYFYLINIFGPVPLTLTTDFQKNQTLERESIENIYTQIILDLETSKSLLSEEYPTAGRIRANKSAAESMLARTYLYLGDWEKAEENATAVISKSQIYKLVDLESVFLANSNEAVLQLMPQPNNNTEDGSLFIPGDLSNSPTSVSLNPIFAINESKDRRKEVWIAKYANNTGTYFYPVKYKIRFSTTTEEYTMVLRLGELYLIRAEARINSGKIVQGLTDLNFLRARYKENGNRSNSIPDIPINLNLEEAKNCVVNERQVELFSEWGHRWLDLKRLTLANSVLSKKPNWSSTDVLFPIPIAEINRNLKIKQNDGY